jgi:putative DNA primase/helicase
MSSLHNVEAYVVTPQKHAPYFPLTDAGNGERFAAMHKDTARYCPEWKKWLVWDGMRWTRDTRGEVFLKAKLTARSITEDLKDCFDSETRKSIYKWAAQCEGGQRIREMLSAAEKEPEIAVLAGELDQNPWLFNLPNGTLDLHTGKLLEHDPSDLITQIGGCEYDAHAQCPNWHVFLDQLFPDKEDKDTQAITPSGMPHYLQRVIGYSLTGTITEQMINVLQGKGSNGKSLTVGTMLALFGEYGHTMEPDTITVRRNEKMATDIADLFGKRFVDCAETDEGKRFNEAMIKRMTGGEKLIGERKYENPFAFTPQFQIFFSTNHRPEVRGTDKGIWRRIQLVAFEQTFWDADKGETGLPHLQANKNLAEELKAELPGILNWAIEGCLAWQKDGLKAPVQIQNATNQYREEQDVLGAFLEDKCEMTTGVSVGFKELYTKYGSWCEEVSEFKIKQRAFNNALRERGFESEQGGANNTNFWKGLGLKERYSDWESK